MGLNPYLHFDGDCEDALKFYETVLHGKITMLMRHGDAPPDARGPAEFGQRIMHGRLDWDGTILMASDAPPGRYAAPQGFTVSLNFDDPAEADRVFAALSEGGAVQMPISETFWAHRFGMLKDKFGIPWMVNCEKTG